MTNYTSPGMVLITRCRRNAFAAVGEGRGKEANSDSKLMLFYTSSCGGHVGDIKPSESHSKHETSFFNLQPLSPGLCFNYEQGKTQGGGRKGANISEWA